MNEPGQNPTQVGSTGAAPAPKAVPPESSLPGLSFLMSALRRARPRSSSTRAEGSGSPFPLHSRPPLRPGNIALIACRVLENEIQALATGATHIVRQEWFDIGLHDTPGMLRQMLEGALARAEADPSVEEVVLAYGLCGCATVGLSPQRCAIVIPRAHDCLTLLLGSKERYADIMRTEPGLYWYTPGWNRDRRVAGPDREEQLRRDFSARLDPEQVEAIIEADRDTFASHTCAGYTDLGMGGDEWQRAYAERCAETMGWKFRWHRGDSRLLRALIFGPWEPQRFLVIRPGEKIAHSVDERVVRTAPAASPTAPVPPPAAPLT